MGRFNCIYSVPKSITCCFPKPLFPTTQQQTPCKRFTHSNAGPPGLQQVCLWACRCRIGVFSCLERADAAAVRVDLSGTSGRAHTLLHRLPLLTALPPHFHPIQQQQPAYAMQQRRAARAPAPPRPPQTPPPPPAPVRPPRAPPP